MDIKIIGIAIISTIGFTGLIIYLYPWISPCCAACWGMRKRQRARRARTVPVNMIELTPLQPPPPYNPERFTYVPPIYNINLAEKNLPHIAITINRRPWEALIDTGAGVSFISKKVADSLNLKLRHTNKQGTAANGSAVTFLGTTPIDIKIGKTTLTPEVLVAMHGHSPADMIIGHDLCKLLKAEVNFNTNEFSMLGEAIPIMLLTENELPKPELAKVIVTEPTVIKKGDNFLYGYANMPLERGSIWLTSHSENFKRTGLMVGSSISSENGHQRIPLRIMNITNAEITLHPGTIVADLQQVSKDDVCSEENRSDLPVNILLEDQEYMPEEADISRNLPFFPIKNISVTAFLLEKLNLEKSALTNVGKELLQKIIVKHKDAFVGPDGKIGKYNGPIRPRIELIDSKKFIAERPRRVPPALQEVVDKQIKEMLEQKIIRPSTSPFLSPIVMVRKADKKSWRMAIDYRRLNSETKKQSNFLPLITDVIDKCAGKTLYSALDLTSAFHQIPLRECDMEKTAFAVNSSVYEFQFLPFGLSLAPRVFQSIIESIQNELHATIFCYLDDILITSANEQAHLKDIEEVLSMIEKYGLKLRVDKCHFGMKEIKYLGFLVSKEGVRPDPANVERVKNFPQPKTLTELRSVIGAVSYFRRFIKNFATIMAPLHELTTQGENVKNNWQPKHEEAFKMVVQKLIEAPVLAAPIFGKPNSYQIHTDASKIACAAVLLQTDQNEQLHPICYYSRKMNVHESKYSSIELEALAVVAALKEFRPYIEGAGTTTIVTDSSAVCSLMKNKNLQGRLAKFQLAIQAFDIKFSHRAGKDNHLCDYMSRYPANAITLRSGRAVASAIPLKKVIEEQKKEYGDVYEAILNKRFPTDETKKVAMENKIKDLVMKNRAIYYFNEEESDDIRLLIPYSLRQKIIEEFHNNELQGAHLGQLKTLEKMKTRTYWPGMATDVAETIRTCARLPESKNQSRRSSTRAHPTD